MKDKIQDWVDKRFGKPNTFNTQILVDFLNDWLLEPDNSDGYELPYSDARWIDEEGLCFWCKTATHWVDPDYMDYVCSSKCQREMEQNVKAKSEPKADESGLLTDKKVKAELEKYFTEDEMLLPEPIFTTVSGIIAVVRKAQRDLDRAECQKRIEKTEFNILEYFRHYARQLELKCPNPTIEEQGWLGNIWDMIKWAGKGEWQALKEGKK